MMREDALSLAVSKRMTLSFVAALLVATVALFGLGIRTAETQTSPAPTTYYEVVDLGSLGGTQSEPSGINNSGQVVGYSETATSGEWHAFLYDESATPKMQDLGTLGGSNSYAMGINDSGQVVGLSETATSGETHAFLYDSTNGMKDLGTLGGSNSYAYDINNSGQVVGSSDDTSDGTDAFIWKDDGDNTTTDMKAISEPEGIWIGTWPWGPYSYAKGINDSGQVVGQTNNHAFLYDSATKKIKDLGVLGYCCSSDAYGINASGQVVGYSYDSSGEWHAFLYSGGSMQDLGSLGLQNAIPQNGVNWADDINDSGQIVGYSDHGNFNDAFLYQNGQMIDLSTRLLPEVRDDWKLGESTSINNDGQIVVYAYPTTGAEIDFTEHALLLTPKTTASTAPTTPSTPNLDWSSDTGASQTDNLTNDDTPTFTGTADEGSTVKIYVDGAEKGSGKAPGGSYIVTTSTLQPVNHSITAKASNSYGESGESQPLTITIDKTAPSVNSVSPQNSATNVLRNTNLTATFSEKMDPASITNSSFTLTKQGGSTIGASVAYDTATNKATLTPNAALDANATYTATIKGGISGAKDAAGNPLAQNYTWSFTTAPPPPDTTAPTVLSTTPTSDQKGVTRNTDLTATFSEKMDPLSITTNTFKLYKCSSTTSTSCTSEVTDVKVTLSTDGIKATLNPFPTSPTALLGSKTKYKAIVSTGAKDIAGNALDQSPSTTGNQQKEWYFTTGSS